MNKSGISFHLWKPGMPLRADYIWRVTVLKPTDVPDEEG
jgi:hypothetical protein